MCPDFETMSQKYRITDSRTLPYVSKYEITIKSIFLFGIFIGKRTKFSVFKTVEVYIFPSLWLLRSIVGNSKRNVNEIKTSF